jgi:hypothetical protein
MSKLILILGIVVTAAAIAVGFLVFLLSGQMQVLGITPGAAATLLVGGLGLVGISAIITTLDRGVQATTELRRLLASRGLPSVETLRAEAPRNGTAQGLAAASAAAAAATEEPSLHPSAEPSPSEPVVTVSVATAETIAALDKAKEEISEALGETPAEAAQEADLETEQEGDQEEEAEEAGEEGGEEQLYVVEERLIRGRPARVLSDGTVEAETDEGWMRFENREHLEEYLDAMSPERS